MAKDRSSALSFLCTALLLIAGCGGGGKIVSNGNGSNPGGNEAPSLTVAAIAPSTVVAGNRSITLAVFGSGFTWASAIKWNSDLIPITNIGSTHRLTATIPASYLTTVGTANITVTNPGVTSAPQKFTITAAKAPTTWVRKVPGVVPQSIEWDPEHSLIYAAIGADAATSANSIVAIDPVTGQVVKSVTTGDDPDLLSESSDGSYLWAGMDGSGEVQRYLLPGLTPDISFFLPKDAQGNTLQPFSLEAARVNPHTVAVAGINGFSSGVYVYDDATQRPVSIEGSEPYRWLGSGWLQWGNDDSILFGSDVMQVTPSGVALDGQQDVLGDGRGAEYIPQTNLLYFGTNAFDPLKSTQVGRYDGPDGDPLIDSSCTADGSLNRYYCMTGSSLGTGEVTDFKLWIYDLSTYSLLNVVDFDSSTVAGAKVTGQFDKLIRWGDAGLALITRTDLSGRQGDAGFFLINGQAVNPNVIADGSTDDPNSIVPAISVAPSISSISPEYAPVGSAAVNLTITGQNFTPSTIVCGNCFGDDPGSFLPTTYVSPTQLNATIPTEWLAYSGTIQIGIFDPSFRQYSTAMIPFTVFAPPTASATNVSVVDLSGLDMVWDKKSQLLYVATADYDPAYPNSIVAVNPVDGSIKKHAWVGSNPAFLSVSAGGQYLYMGYDGATTETRVALPGLDSLLSWPLRPGAYVHPKDLKAAPQNPDLSAVNVAESSAEGEIVVFDGATRLPNTVSVSNDIVNQFFNRYDVLAWGNSDTVLCSAADEMNGALYTIAVDASGATYLNRYPNFSGVDDELHSDFGTGLVYSDSGNVANPATGEIVGSFHSSGLVVPDSTLNRVFILGQTSAQAISRSYTIKSFDEQHFTGVTSITLNGLSGKPFKMERWGNSGLAVMTTGGLIYLIQDAKFVSGSPASAVAPDSVKMLWSKPSRFEIGNILRRRPTSEVGKNPFLTSGDSK